VGGRVTFPLMGSYHASKYALEALSDALRMELAPFGVHVVLIEPGAIRTEFATRMSGTAETYRRAESLYAASFERADEVERRTMATASGPEPVIAAMQRAIESRRPRARYVTPRYNLLVLWLLRALPTRLSDALKRAAFNLSPRRLAASSDAPRLVRGTA
jgi:short-subunit dehydrogenase